MQFPVRREDIQNSIDEFEEKYGFPQIVGEIDGCHIEINAPPRNHEDYFNRKQHYSVVLQALIHSNLKFLERDEKNKLHSANYYEWDEKKKYLLLEHISFHFQHQVLHQCCVCQIRPTEEKS